VLLWSLVGVVSLLAGNGDGDFRDGIRQDARFWMPRGLLCTRDGSKVIVADYFNNRLRMIDAATKQVTTIAGTGEHEHSDGPACAAALCSPEFLAFDSTTPTPESVLYISGAGLRSEGVLRRLNLLTKELGTIRLSLPLHLNGIAATPSGALIAVCGDTSVYAISPSSGHCELVESGRNPMFGELRSKPRAVAVVDSHCAAYMFDLEDQIRRVSLHAKYFIAPIAGTSLLSNRLVLPSLCGDS
jgi:hypothetical protein